MNMFLFVFFMTDALLMNAIMYMEMPEISYG